MDEWSHQRHFCEMNIRQVGVLLELVWFSQGGFQAIRWNCWGLGNPRSIRALRILVQQWDPDFVSYQVTGWALDLTSDKGSGYVKSSWNILEITVEWTTLRAAQSYGHGMPSLKFLIVKLKKENAYTFIPPTTSGRICSSGKLSMQGLFSRFVLLVLVV